MHNPFHNTIFIDPVTEFTGVFYYRLKQVDFDDVYTISKIVTIQAATHAQFTVYPNPAGEQLFLKTQLSGTSHLTIMDMSGKALLTATSNALLTEIDTRFLAAGVYILEYTNPEHNQTFFERILLK